MVVWKIPISLDLEIKLLNYKAAGFMTDINKLEAFGGLKNKGLRSTACINIVKSRAMTVLVHF